MTVKEFAQKYTSPLAIRAITEAIDSGKEVRLVVGKLTYDLIRNDPDASRSYDGLISKGMKIAFNPTVNPETEAFANDRGDAGVLKRMSGVFTEIHNSHITRQIIFDLYSESMRIRDFKKSSEELTREFNECRGIVRH